MVNLIILKAYEIEFFPESIAFNLNNAAGTYKFVAVQYRIFLRIEFYFDL